MSPPILSGNNIAIGQNLISNDNHGNKNQINQNSSTLDNPKIKSNICNKCIAILGMGVVAFGVIGGSVLATIGTVTATPIIAGIATVIGTGILIAAIYKHLSNTTANVNEALSKANNPESQKIIRENQKVAVDIFNKMESKQAVDIFNKMESKQAVDIFNKMESKQAVDIFSKMESKQAVDIFSKMESKQAVDIFSKIESRQAAFILNRMSSNVALNFLDEINNKNQKKSKKIISEIERQKPENKDYLKPILLWNNSHNRYLLTEEINSQDISLAKKNVESWWGQPNPKTTRNHGDDFDSVAARVVSRQPNSEVKSTLNKIHSVLADKFLDMSDESLMWLVKGSSATSRGGFNDSNSLRTFLEQQPSTISSSRMLTGIESIATAMAYRSIEAHWVDGSSLPTNTDSKLMHETIMNVVAPYKVRNINEVYCEKECERRNRPFQFHVITTSDRRMSDASDCDESVKLPKESNPLYIATRKARGGFSWVGSAEASNINVRSHVSGTAPLTLAAISGLLGDYKFDKQALFGAIILPQYLRGDYHSFAEGGAGIHHFMKESHGLRSNALHPKEALRYSYDCMISALRDTKNENEDLSPKQAMIILFSLDFQSKQDYPVNRPNGDTLIFGN